MVYTISDVSNLMDISVYTLRYYEKEGLLPFLNRKGRSRIFSETDIEWIGMIKCLKDSGLPLKEIKIFLELYQAGDTTLAQRFEMFKERRTIIMEQIKDLEQILQTIDYKYWYYQTAIHAGTEDIHKTLTEKRKKPKTYGRREDP
ncbi:MAG: MerR family transcriptional regulator [Spirochaetia bacterium]